MHDVAQKKWDSYPLMTPPDREKTDYERVHSILTGYESMRKEECFEQFLIHFMLNVGEEVVLNVGEGEFSMVQEMLMEWAKFYVECCSMLDFKRVVRVGLINKHRYHVKYKDGAVVDTMLWDHSVLNNQPKRWGLKDK